MKSRVDIIRDSIKSNIFAHSDELVIVGLRIIELLEELKGEKNAGRREPRPVAESGSEPEPKPRPKRKPVKRKPKPGFKRGGPRLAGKPAGRVENGKESPELQGDTRLGKVLPGGEEGK
jgi:hypothetical protein